MHIMPSRSILLGVLFCYWYHPVADALNLDTLQQACRAEDGYYDCGNGQCISRRSVKDTRNDCDNNADEIGHIQCTDNEVHCRFINRCVPRYLINTQNSCIANEQLILPCRKDKEFMCTKSLKCIQRWKVMDGKYDCATMLIPNDTSDEEAPLSNCTNSELRCQSEGNSTKCIPRDWVMDGVPDCSQGTDELSALVCDQEKEFQCVWNGRCIPRYRVNDDYKDCEDGSDEAINITCLNTEFACLGINDSPISIGRRCIPKTWQLNNITDCADESDEFTAPLNGSCPEGSFQCENSLRCIPRSYLCDGLDHCGDCSDEIEECEVPVMFRCPNDIRRTCLHWSYACDPYADCPNVEDDIFTVGPGFKCQKQNGLSDVKQYCILPQWSLKDSYFSCDDRSDLCYQNDTFHCSLCLDGKTVIAPRQICDGIFDCPDLSDECLCVASSLETAELCNNVCYGYPSSPCSKCNKEEFLCDGMCLPYSKVCNGILDCHISSIDERWCTIESETFMPIRPKDFTCEPVPDVFQRAIEFGNFGYLANKSFPIMAKSCDGITECRNMEDECSERANCENKPKVCTDIPIISQVIPSSFVPGLAQDVILEIRRCSGLFNFAFGFSICNGISECQNGEDERNCTKRFECDAGQRDWLTGTKSMVSIANSKKCDAVYPPDCLDSSDEINCNDSTHFYCESGTPFFVRRDQVVDGKRDCADASDECPPDMFQTRALSSREELIKVPSLRAMVWFMAFVAIIGNCVVFILSSKSLIENSKKAKSARAPGVVVINKLLILNLSFADLLMGVALLIIGIKSAQFSGQYCWRDLLWRSSTTCDVIGVLSVLSCEASVLSLVCLTSYRLYTIYFPLKSRTVSVKVSIIWIMCIWAVCFILALLPLVDQLSRYMVATMLIKTTPYLTTEIIQFNQLLEFTKRISATQRNVSVDGVLTTGSWSVLQHFLSDNFPKYVPERVGYFGYYSASAVCLPRYFKLPTDQVEINAISPVIMSFNFIALLYICAAYAAIYKRTYSGNMAVDTAQRQQTEQRQKNAKKMQRKISILILTDLCCWLPVCLMTFISLRKTGLHDSVYSYSAIILLPINSSLNPIIYTDAVPKLYTKLKQIGLQVKTLVNNDKTQIPQTETPNVTTTSV
ncbi:uncharacterized protein LOC108950445 isoform X1 [Ciona intestinalis]